ncbi:MAG TPA: RDD family protein [Planctomycetota bacterium]|jgi:uncharacterized RDD family membrane protein YckC
MSIRFSCTCGEKLVVPDATRGRKAYCLKCKKTIQIPDASEELQADSRQEAGGGSDNADAWTRGRGDAEKRNEASALATEQPLNIAPPPPATEAQSDELAVSEYVPEPEPAAEVIEPAPEPADIAETSATAPAEVLQTPAPSEAGQVPPAKSEEPSVSDGPPLKTEDVPARAVETPPRCEKVHDADGKEYWKLTCFCGKHVRSPASIDQPYGRCPKCGRRMKLPGYLLSGRPFLISARPGQGPLAAPSRTIKLNGSESKGNTPPTAALNEDAAALATAENDIKKYETPVLQKAVSVDKPAGETPHEPAYDDTIPLLADDDAPEPTDVARAAASTAADRLRPHHAEDHGYDAGRISAWPLAGKLSRALAAFIDVTFATTLTGTIVALASHDVLPALFLSKEMVLALLVLSGVLNDGLIHVIWGGSLGKKLVVIVTRNAYGEELGALHLLIRALLKWMLIPGWILGLIDPNERTLHDLLCGTLVLKGRTRSRG